MLSHRYVDEMDSVDNLEKYNPPPLMCLVEKQKGGMGADEKVCIAMIAICPSSGDIVWDHFEGEAVTLRCHLYLTPFKIHICVSNSRSVLFFCCEENPSRMTLD
jgi:hypothetical protein